MSEADLAVEDVLAKVEEVLAEYPSDYGNLHCMDGLECLLHIDELHDGDARWGSYRTVIYGFRVGYKSKYIGVTYYHFSGDSDGDPEASVQEYEVAEVSTFQWRPKRKKIIAT